jgi:hypothetical protein
LKADGLTHFENRVWTRLEGLTAAQHSSVRYGGYPAAQWRAIRSLSVGSAYSDLVSSVFVRRDFCIVDAHQRFPEALMRSQSLVDTTFVPTDSAEHLGCTKN